MFKNVAIETSNNTEITYWYEIYDINGKLIEARHEEEIEDLYNEKFTGILIGLGTEEGRIWYYENGILHRVNGPAYIHKKDKVYQWHFNGQLHRIGGPAHVNIKRGNEYFIYDKKITKEEHDLLYSITRLKGLLI